MKKHEKAATIRELTAAELDSVVGGTNSGGGSTYDSCALEHLANSFTPQIIQTFNNITSPLRGPC
jgi:hypothetical protein